MSNEELVDRDRIVGNLFTQNVFVQDNDGNMGQLFEIDAYLVGGDRVQVYFPESLLPGLMQAVVLTWQNHFPDTGMRSGDLDEDQLQQLLEEGDEGNGKD